MIPALLDTNLFITSKYHLPRDIFPSFWNRLGETLQSGDALLHQAVLDELNQKKDEIVPWLRSLADVKPRKASSSTLDKYLEVCEWAAAGDFSDGAVREFRSTRRADAWLVAEAAVSGFVVVTHETRSSTRNKVKIPVACEAFGVEWLSGYDFMRRQGFRF